MTRLLLLTFAVACAAEETTTPADDSSSDISEIPTPSADNDDEMDDSSNQNDDSSNNDSQSEPAETLEYQFNESDSLLYVQVWKDPSASLSGFAHDHVVRADDWTGIIAYNADDISECEFDFSVPVAKLKVDEDAMRQHVGYDDTIKTSDRSQIREHMLADNQLNADGYSEITFSSTGCEKSGSDSLSITGEMFIAGTSRNISLDVDFSIRNGKAYVSGEYNFTHSDYNIEPYTAFFGQVRNGEDLRITFDMAGQAL